MTPEERQAYIRAEAHRRLEARKQALGVSSATSPSAASLTLDTIIEDRLAQEKMEAEEKTREAERQAAEREKTEEGEARNQQGAQGRQTCFADTHDGRSSARASSQCAKGRRQRFTSCATSVNWDSCPASAQASASRSSATVEESHSSHADSVVVQQPAFPAPPAPVEPEEDPEDAAFRARERPCGRSGKIVLLSFASSSRRKRMRGRQRKRIRSAGISFWLVERQRW